MAALLPKTSKMAIILPNISYRQAAIFLRIRPPRAGETNWFKKESGQ